MKTELISTIEQQPYKEFLDKIPNVTFFHSFNHINYLKDILKIEPNFFVTYDKNEIIGILPFFMKKTSAGKIINSLPFFGSYGGIITDNKIAGTQLVQNFNSFVKYNDILSAVLITKPFNGIDDLLEKEFEYNFSEERFTQCTILKDVTIENLFSSFEKRVRWSIKKSEKQNIEVKIINSDNEHMEYFYKLHVNSMKAKNGNPKPKLLFTVLTQNFIPTKDYDIFIAFKENQPISYILIFYYKGFAEYYMPAYDPKFRDSQSTSYLIWCALKKAIEKKIKFFNFGGTWKSQKELYLFKRGWNARDFHYKYYGKSNLDLIKEIGLKRLQKDFEHFYLCPYELINANEK